MSDCIAVRYGRVPKRSRDLGVNDENPTNVRATPTPSTPITPTTPQLCSFHEQVRSNKIIATMKFEIYPDF